MQHNYLVYQLKSIIDARNLYLVWHQDNHPGEPAKLPLALLDIKAFCMSCGRAGFSFTRIINYIFGVLCMFMGRYYFIINKFLQLSSTFQINILAQQVPSRARKEPHKISEEGRGRSGHSAEEASLPSRLQTYFGLPQVRSTSCPSK